MMALQMRVEDLLFIQAGVESTDFAKNMSAHKMNEDPEYKVLMEEYVKGLQAAMQQKAQAQPEGL